MLCWRCEGSRSNGWRESAPRLESGRGEPGGESESAESRGAVVAERAGGDGRGVAEERCSACGEKLARGAAQPPRPEEDLANEAVSGSEAVPGPEGVDPSKVDPRSQPARRGKLAEQLARFGLTSQTGPLLEPKGK